MTIPEVLSFSLDCSTPITAVPLMKANEMMMKDRAICDLVTMLST